MIYRSKKRKSLSDDHIQNILLTALFHNSIHHISGMLIYDDTSFVQVIEGEQNEIYHLMRRILIDSRHSNVTILQRKPIVTREFVNWTMQAVFLPQFYKQYYSKIHENESPYLYYPSEFSNLASLCLKDVQEVLQFAADVVTTFPDFGILPYSEINKAQI
jgi:hypothetical protein